MINYVYVAKQPILDKKLNIFAYEILYRDASKKENIENSRYTSAAVISSILNKFGTKQLLGNRRAFVSIDEKFLLSDIVFSVPKEFFVLSVKAETLGKEQMLKRVGELYKKGYMLSVETAAVNETFFEIYGAALRFFAYCKVLDNVDKNAIEKLHENSMEVIAVHIEDEESYLRMKNFGCDAFEGYFFAQPKIVTSEEHNPSRMAVLQLYNKLMEDNSIDEVADEFEKNPEITVQLLQFVNSASFHFRTKIASIQQVIVLLGRLELAQWLMLMIYAKSVSSNTEMSPLMIMVKNRAELMQRVLKEVSPKIEKERVAEAYMVGVLSLMDTLFSMPLIEILDNLNVSAEVKDALLYDKGTLGDIYKFVRSLESMDGEGISDFELRYKVASQKIRTIVLDSLEVVAKLENPSENEV